MWCWRRAGAIEALLSEAGGTASVWGVSSGAVLALDAANRPKGIKKLALYKPSFIPDDSRSTTYDDWVRIGEAVAADRRSDAVKIFLKSVGVPGFFVRLMRLMPKRWKSDRSALLSGNGDRGHAGGAVRSSTDVRYLRASEIRSSRTSRAIFSPPLRPSTRSNARGPLNRAANRVRNMSS